MDLEKFEKLKENYRNDLGKNQSTSVWFDRKTLENLLTQTDPEKGGIKIYFGQYDESTLSEVDNDERCINKLTVILTATNDNEDPKEESQVQNGGRLCPPYC